MGIRTNVSFWSDELYGPNGDMYGTPKDRKLHKWRTNANNPRAIPNNPKEAASIIMMKRSILTAIAMSYEGDTKLEIAVIDTTITMVDVIIPASTAAVPITNAPTIDIVGPIDRGIRAPASRKISKVISMINASIKAGKGTPSLCAAKFINKAVGIISK